MIASDFDTQTPAFISAFAELGALIPCQASQRLRPAIARA